MLCSLTSEIRRPDSAADWAAPLSAQNPGAPGTRRHHQRKCGEKTDTESQTSLKLLKRSLKDTTVLHIPSSQLFIMLPFFYAPLQLRLVSPDVSIPAENLADIYDLFKVIFLPCWQTNWCAKETLNHFVFLCPPPPCRRSTSSLCTGGTAVRRRRQRQQRGTTVTRIAPL